MSKAIRWMFFFDEGNVKSDLTNEQEDKRIEEFLLENGQGMLRLPGDHADILVNLSRVKCISRQEVDLEAEKKFLEEMKAKAAAPQPAGQ